MGAPMPAELRAKLHRHQPAEWAIPCPGCGAKPGTPCHTPKGRTVHDGTHPSRADAWIIHQHTA